MATAKKIREEKVIRDDQTDPELVGALGMTAGGVAGGIAAGAAAAGLVTGATMGAAAGPIGIVAGAAIGGAIGGALAEDAAWANIEEEDQYWSETYTTRSYVRPNASYETYRPAYRYGAESYGKFEDRSFDEVETDVSRDWTSRRGTSSLEWNEAREATRDAYERVRENARRNATKTQA